MGCEALEERRMLAITLEVAGTYETGLFDDSAAEIAAYDPDSQQLYVTNVADATVDIIDISDPATPTKTGTLDVSGAPTSVSISAGLVAVAVPADPETDPGTVEFFETDGDAIGSVTIGALPDMLTFTPNLHALRHEGIIR
jgi:DNA-binding beta-propeller fold protein YncE